MSRIFGWVGCIILIVAPVAPIASLPSVALAGPAPAPLSAAEETLKAKGLTRVGTTFVIDADARLPEQLRKMRAAKRQLEEHARKRQNLEADIRKAETAATRWLREYTDLKARLKPGLSVREHNALADQINARVAGLKEAETFLKDKEKELKNLVEPRDDYVSSLLDLSDNMEAAAKEYETLAKDPEVAGALDKYNATAKPKARLGPSAQFTAELQPVRQMRKMLDASSIPLTMSGGVPHVEVQLNGTHTQRMVLDSGASLISITTELANKLDLKPGDDDPSVTLVVADGRKVQARLMKLKRVRVGQFTVEDAVCAILPPEVKGDNNLLGGTFLQHFVYRMDLGTQRLHLSQVAGKPTTPDKIAKGPAAAAGKNPPATLPVSPADKTAASPTSTPAVSGGGVSGGGVSGGGTDLLATVDPVRDVVAGTWTKAADGLVSDESPGARIRVPVKPAAEFDYIVEFTRTRGDDSVALILDLPNCPIMFVFSGAHGAADGFEMIDGMHFDRNPAAVKPSILKTGRRTKCVIQVRNNSIAAVVDGKKVAEFTGPRASLKLADWWKLGPGFVGVGAHGSVAVFHKIEIADARTGG